MKIGLLIAVILLCTSCSDQFINHKMQIEIAGECVSDPSTIKMISNINGERYEFYQCLSDSFDGKNYSIDRRGDSLVLVYPTMEGHKSRFKIILDIDAKPAYHYMVLGNQTLVIAPAEK